MNEEAYSIAFKNTLTEIKNVCPDITWSFIFTKNGAIYAEDEQSNNPATEKAVHSLQTLVEKTPAVGGLDNLLINGDDGNVYVSNIEDMYLVIGTSKDADIPFLRSITSVIFPTVLKLLDNIVAGPTPLKPEPSPPKEKEKIPEFVSAEPSKEPLPEPSEEPSSVPLQQLIVDKLSGLIVRSDTVQVDKEILKRWGAILNTKDVGEVEIESFAGKTVQCKVKSITDSKLEGRGLIRIPEKTCQTLEVRRGELVRVKPFIS